MLAFLLNYQFAYEGDGLTVIRMNPPQFLSLLALGCAACTTPPLPPLPASHPASKEATPGMVDRYFSSLQEDGATRATKRLLLESESAETKMAPTKTPGMPMEHSDMTMPPEHRHM